MDWKELGMSFVVTMVAVTGALYVYHKFLDK
jgi:hypothetical protein